MASESNVLLCLFRSQSCVHLSCQSFPTNEGGFLRSQRRGVIPLLDFAVCSVEFTGVIRRLRSRSELPRLPRFFERLVEFCVELLGLILREELECMGYTNGSVANTQELVDHHRGQAPRRRGFGTRRNLLGGIGGLGSVSSTPTSSMSAILFVLAAKPRKQALCTTNQPITGSVS